MATIFKKDIELIKIDEACKQQWYDNAKECHNLSNFESTMLRLVGDILRQKGSIWFWCQGAYCWYTDKSQSQEQCVWLTINGNCVFEDCSTHEIYNIRFN